MLLDPLLPSQILCSKAIIVFQVPYRFRSFIFLGISYQESIGMFRNMRDIELGSCRRSCIVDRILCIFRSLSSRLPKGSNHQSRFCRDFTGHKFYMFMGTSNSFFLRRKILNYIECIDSCFLLRIENSFNQSNIVDRLNLIIYNQWDILHKSMVLGCILNLEHICCRLLKYIL